MHATNASVPFHLLTGDQIKARRKAAEASVVGLPLLQATDLKPEAFFTEYMLLNKPCLITGLQEAHFRFPAEQWSAPPSVPSPVNFDQLSRLYGREVVTVADCKEKAGYDQKRAQIKFITYLAYWKSTRSGESKLLLYVKDWHLARDHKKEFGVDLYSLPPYFKEDWLNEYYDHLASTQPESPDDYRFVYMGVKDTWTPLHVDVLRSYSWSHNVIGRKKWLIFPPDAGPGLRGNSPFDVREANEPEYPAISGCMRFECVQGPGETIFIPSGWYHQVHNLEDTVSINQNWANACNIDIMWDFLESDFRSVLRELEDLRGTFASAREFHAQAQLLLKTNSGLNLKDFSQMLAVAAERSAKVAVGDEFAHRVAWFNINRIAEITIELVKCVEALIGGVVSETTTGLSAPALPDASTFDQRCASTLFMLRKVAGPANWPQCLKRKTSYPNNSSCLGE